MRRAYDTDLMDEQWDEVRPYVDAKSGRRPRVSRHDFVCGAHGMSVEKRALLTYPPSKESSLKSRALGLFIDYITV